MSEVTAHLRPGVIPPVYIQVVHTSMPQILSLELKHFKFSPYIIFGLGIGKAKEDSCCVLDCVGVSAKFGRRTGGGCAVTLDTLLARSTVPTVSTK